MTPVRSASAEKTPEWNSLKSRHFIVHYVGEPTFAETVARLAEEYYREIARQLGYTRHDGFWLWHNRARIYIYESRAEFAARENAPDWAVGKADYDRKSISTYSGSQEFARNLLKHELAHLIFRDFVGFQGKVPLWLDEGVAQWLEGSEGLSRSLIRQMVGKGRMLPIRDLTASDVRHERSAGNAAEFYAQSVSLVRFIAEGYGTQQFEKFCRQIRDGKDLNEALRFTYPGTIRSIEELERAWKEHLAKP